MPSREPTRTQAERSDQTKARILDAAIRQFSENGLAGARTERIAEAAGVNKALLYYYFESKEKLYSAALEAISSRIRDRSMAVYMREASAGERLLRIALEHFDRILSQHEFQSLMQQEMMRLHQGETGELPTLVKSVFAPLQSMFQAIVSEGIASGELVQVEWLQIQLAALGANIMFFLSSPMLRMLLDFDAYTPEAIAGRRKAIVEFWGHTLFNDRKHGAELAARVIADSPMPEFSGNRVLFGVRHERKK